MILIGTSKIILVSQLKLRKFIREFAIHAIWVLCFTSAVSITRNNTQQYE
jgi:hypothetical protein